MLRSRIIPCLLIHKGGVVKTQNFKELFEAKEISFDEYKEFLVDLENTKVVEAAAGELEVRTKLNGLISTLISVGSKPINFSEIFAIPTLAPSANAGK